MKYSLDHIGVCGEGGELLIQFLSQRSMPLCSGSGEVCGIKCEFYEVFSHFQLERLMPMEDTKEARALKAWIKKGNVIHHVALNVGNLEREDMVADEKFIGDIVRGAKPHMRVRFLKPEFTGGVLIELIDYWGEVN